jgi:hypothetical protein
LYGRRALAKAVAASWARTAQWITATDGSTAHCGGTANSMQPRSPRVLFVGRSIGHFSYFDSVLAGLIKRNAEVELLLDEHWSRKWLAGLDWSAVEEFTARYPTLRWSWLLRRSDRWRDFIFGLRELRSYRSYLVRAETTPYYIKRWRDYLAEPWKGRLKDPRFDSILRTPAADAALKLAEALTPPDRGILAFVKSRSPDLVLISPMNLRFSEETEYAKAAKRLGIPTAVLTISWDNLSTKGLFHIRPDKLFVWNTYQAADAVEIQQIPRERISITGSPFFDKWFDRSGGLLGREDFCRNAGLDAARPILLYLGSSKNIAKDESWFVQTLHDRLKQSDDPVLRSYQILVRPHPANAEVFGKIQEPDVHTWPKAGELPDTREGFAAMQNSFHHAKAVLGINTSGMIDAVLADRPTYSVKLSRYDQTQSNSKHFKYLEDADALYLLSDLAELWPALAALERGEDPKQPQRLAFAQLFARPHGIDRPAGEVVADEALAMVRRAA